MAEQSCGTAQSRISTPLNHKKQTSDMHSMRLPVLLATTLVTASVVSPSLAATYSRADFFSTEKLIAKNAPEFRSAASLDCVLPPAALTLSQAIDVALCRNPATRAAWAAARMQAASLGVAEGAYLPSISTTGTYNRLSGEITPGTITATEQDGKSVVASLSWTLIDFGARHSEVSNARSLLAAAAHTGSATAQRTVAEVVLAYYSVIATEQAVAANQQTEANTAKSLEIARALRGGGAASLADVMQAETAYQQSVYSRIQAGNAAAASHASLAVLLGFTADQPLALAAVAAPSAPAVTARVGELLSLAAQQRPDLAAARDQRAAAEAAVAAARAAGRPRISLGAQYSVSEFSVLPRQSYNAVGLTITVPIFSGLQTHYGIRRAEAALDEVTEQAEQFRLSVSLDIWKAYHSLEAANQALATSAALLKAATTNEEIAIGRYQSGVGSMLDVLTAQTAGSNARLIRIQSEYSWQTARGQLALAVGRLSSTADLEAVAPTVTVPE